MKRSILKHVAALVLVAGLAACGSPPQPVPDAYKKAFEFNRKGEAAYKRGDFAKALVLYNDALQTNLSMEDFDGMAINLGNLAAVYRTMGDRAGALGCVDVILNAPAGQYGKEMLSDAAYLKAVLSADARDYKEAGIWADKALAYCGGTGCPSAGGAFNLKARLAIKAGNYASAIAYGDEALKINDKAKDGPEKANSLRLIGEAHVRQGRPVEARRYYDRALALDKRLGLGSKVAADLTGIGDALYALKDYGGARSYFERAVRVCEGGGFLEPGKTASGMALKCEEAMKKGER